MKLPLFCAAALTMGMANAQPSDAPAGQALYESACAQCHGSKGRGNMGLPSIAGNDTDYIVSRLKQYRAGEKVGAASAMMMANAADLSDADIKNLAAFISANFL
ncbi:MAG: c-type cytochrome [Oleiphilaceae bacterium]|nr:c-type cytochrome [Oleiphilaceae bacterium]